MSPRTFFILGRTSNLPTVWSNCLAAALLSSSMIFSEQALLTSTIMCAIAITLMYLGGMFLNDAFDAKWDGEHKPDKPIPSGRARLGEVWVWGILLLIAGLALIGLTQQIQALIASVLLVVMIVAYNALHKKVDYGPWLMGACRLLVYGCVSLTITGQLTPQTETSEPIQATGMLQPIIGGLSLMAFIVGLTYLARLEHLNDPGRLWPVLLFAAPVIVALFGVGHTPWAMLLVILFCLWLAALAPKLLPGPRRKVPVAIGGLLAAIPLLDGMLVAASGQVVAGFLIALLFPVTLGLHKVVPGT